MLNTAVNTDPDIAQVALEDIMRSGGHAHFGLYSDSYIQNSKGERTIISKGIEYDHFDPYTPFGSRKKLDSKYPISLPHILPELPYILTADEGKCRFL